MARFLVIVPPLAGHINPTLAVGAALERRGHEVAWVGHPGALDARLPASARRYELPDAVPAGLLRTMTDRSNKVRGLASLKFLWEDFLVPLARAMLPQLPAVLDDYRPDVLLVDQQAVAGALVARQRGLPWATSCSTSAGVTAPLAGLPKVQAWLDEQLAALVAEAGLPATPEPDRSPHLVLVYSSRELAAPDQSFPEQIRFVGPSLGRKGPPVDFPWEALDPSRPKVLVSLGTVNAERGARFFAAAAEALAAMEVQGILVAPEGRVGDLPTNVIRRDFVPQLELLPHLSAVICHGGQNTVSESLAHGLPLLVAPIRDDQPVIAEQVVAAGCGLRLRFSRSGAAEIREALEAILSDEGYAARAAAIGESLKRAGGAEAAAEALIALDAGAGTRA
ncbi:MAG: glycosyltransferase [Deltaproteobacteria bacterium]|nr:glycosyltransferase [Deltaproteobacteria bacterium]